MIRIIFLVLLLGGSAVLGMPAFSSNDAKPIMGQVPATLRTSVPIVGETNIDLSVLKTVRSKEEKRSHGKRSLLPLRAPELQSISTKIFSELKPLSKSISSNTSNVYANELQQQTLRELNSGLYGGTASFSPDNGTLRYLRLEYQAAGNASKNSAIEVANNFISEYSGLFRLEDPVSELAIIETRIDDLGFTHFKFEQRYLGVPVWASEVLVHLNNLNRIYLINGSYEPTPSGLEIEPVLSGDEAEKIVANELNNHRLSKVDPTFETRLVVYSGNGTEHPLLAYEVQAQREVNEAKTYFVDVGSGEIIHSISDLYTATVNATGQGLNGESIDFVSTEVGGIFRLFDPTFPIDDPPYPQDFNQNGRGDTVVIDLNQDSSGSITTYSQSSQPYADWDPVAITVYGNTRIVYDYFLDTFGRNSVDGHGHHLTSLIHPGREEDDNAGWAKAGFMIYGDGDVLFRNLARCLDVAAHELTHGVIQFSANLKYEFQSGALNESFSDIFAAMVDSADWLIGEDCTKLSPGFLRDMANPERGKFPQQPRHMSGYQNMTINEDNGGVHVNSGIPNRAAYLVAEGLTSEGLGNSIGRDKTERIYYRALVTYLTSRSQFLDARRALVDSARDLHGLESTEVLAIHAAFDAVGINDSEIPGPDSTPTTSQTLNGDDFMVYLAPDDEGTRLEIYVQPIPNPFAGYNSASLIGPLSSVAASFTRPTILTAPAGTFIFYVSQSYDIYVIEPDGTNEQITEDGIVHSFSVSPDGRFAAFTTIFSGDNQIHVVDLQTGTLQSTAISSISYSQGVEGDSAFFADSLNFSFSGDLITFDALFCASLPGDPCDGTPDGGLAYWSIGVFEHSTKRFFYPFYADPAFDLGYPVFAYNNEYVLGFDFNDYSTTSDSGNIKSGVLALNAVLNDIYSIAQFAPNPLPIWSSPSFWPADDFVTINPDTAYHAARVPLNQNFAGNQANAEVVNPGQLGFPVMHRVAIRDLSGDIDAPDLVEFSNVAVDSFKERSFTVTNLANKDLSITDIQLSHPNFSHNAYNTVLPGGTSMEISVKFHPSTTGSQLASLVFVTNGDAQGQVVTLSGVGISKSNSRTNEVTNESSSSGGCSVLANGRHDFGLMILLFVAAFGLLARRSSLAMQDGSS